MGKLAALILFTGIAVAQYIPPGGGGGSGGTCASLGGDVSGTCAANTVGKINGVSMAGLATGILKNTTATGAPSIAVAADLPTGTLAAGAFVIPTGGSLTVSGSGTNTATALTGAATGTSLTLTGALTTGSGSGVAGILDLAQGTLPTLGTTAISLLAPTSVTSYGLLYPGAAPAANQVLLMGAPSSSISTGVFTTMILGATNLTTAGAIPYVSASGTLQQDQTSSHQLFWDATNHRLGIGTTSPAEDLHVNGYITATGMFLADGVNGVWGAGAVRMRADAHYAWSPSTNANIGADTNLSRDSAGVVAVGTGTLGSTAGSISLTGITASGATVVFSGLGSATGTPDSVCLNTNTLKRNAALTCTVSSENVKNSFASIPATDFMALRPLQFQYNDVPGRTRWGFGAQQVASVNPALADGWRDDGTPWSLDQNAILALTVKTVQEFERRLKSLEQQ